MTTTWSTWGSFAETAAAARGLRQLPAVSVLILFVLAACAQQSVTEPPAGPQPAPTQPSPPFESSLPPGAEQEPARRFQDLTLPDSEARVALLLPMTGRHAKIGQALLNAAQLALFDTPEQRFALLVRDTGGTPQGAVAAARSALDDGATLILGPLFSIEVQAMAPEAQRAGVTVISFSNDRGVTAPGVFVMGLDPQLQVDRVVGYAQAQGIQRFAVLAPTTPYGDTVLRAMQNAVFQNGPQSQLVRTLSYDPSTGDASAEVRSLAEYDRRRQALIAERQRLSGRNDAESRRALRQLEGHDTFGPPNYEAVMLPLGGQSLLSLAPLLPYYDIDPQEVQYLGTALWDDPSLANERALVGGWFAAPPPQLWEGFKARYEQSYGSAPPRIASLAYDATALAAVLAGRAFADGRARAFEFDMVTQPSGFSGVDGIFRFLPDGGSQRGLAVLEMQREGFAVRDPAPNTFQPLAF